MHLHLPHPQRLSESTRTVREAFWLTVICMVSAFAFFMVVGSVSPGTAGVATAIAATCALAFAWHAWHAGRSAARDERIIRARERRGF